MGAKMSGPQSGKSYTIESNADINVTPFVDVMLVLLIIFMVSIPMATVSIKLDMPPAKPPENPTEEDKPTYISLIETGELFIVDTPTKLDTLAVDLEAALRAKKPNENPREQLVFVRADPEVKYEQFLEVLNDLQDKGFLKIGLINEDIA